MVSAEFPRGRGRNKKMHERRDGRSGPSPGSDVGIVERRLVKPSFLLPVGTMSFRADALGAGSRSLAPRMAAHCRH